MAGSAGAAAWRETAGIRWRAAPGNRKKPRPARRPAPLQQRGKYAPSPPETGQTGPAPATRRGRSPRRRPSERPPPSKTSPAGRLVPSCLESVLKPAECRIGANFFAGQGDFSQAGCRPTGKINVAPEKKDVLRRRFGIFRPIAILRNHAKKRSESRNCRARRRTRTGRCPSRTARQRCNTGTAELFAAFLRMAIKIRTDPKRPAA